jgi:hypothetical protein
VVARQQVARRELAEHAAPRHLLAARVCEILQASLPLFACNLQFFVKFGTFLCLTILFSWLFANFCFMGVLATIGRSKEKPAKK